MIKAVFFDFGGTLMSVESDKKAHYYLMESVKSKYGLNENAEDLSKKYTYYTHSYPAPMEYRKAFGKGNIMNAFMKILKNKKASESKIPRSFIAQLKYNFLCNKKPDYEWFWDEYLKMHRRYVHLYPGAVEALSWVKKNNFHLGMISDIDTDYLFDQLNALKITNLFDSITTSEEAGFRKPDKRIFNAALKKARCSENEAVYVGDKIDRDIVGGKNVGMKTILFSNGSNSLNNSSDYPDFITDKLNRIPDIVSRLMKGIKE